MLTLPASVEDVPLSPPGGAPVLWLRVKVLTVPEAAGSMEALRSVMALAKAAATGETPSTEDMGPVTTKGVADGLTLMHQIARRAVIAAAMPGADGPADFEPVKLTPNAEQESVADGVLCYATLDQIDTLWAAKAAGVALRAATGAIALLGKSSATGKP